MIESLLIENSYFSNKNDDHNLTEIIKSINLSRKTNLDIAQMVQTHSNNIENVNTKGMFISDGIITSKENISLVVETADCMPVLIKSENSIAALHVGWRGIENKIFQLAIQKLGRESLKVSIGPHAQSCCYEVQKDVAELFSNNIIEKNNKLYLNLADDIRNYCRLNNIQIEVSTICTICSIDFWSYRENKTKERQYSLIWI